MTRAELKQRIRVLGSQLFNTGADQDPFGLDLLLIEQANQIARATDCLVGRRYLDLISGEDEYCSPDVYKIRGIFYLTGGEYKRLKQVVFSSTQFDSHRNDGSASTPDICAVYGMNRIRLKPAPSSAVTNGLIIEGYCQPGNIWQYDANGVSDPGVPVEDHVCPLPEVAQDCLIYGVLYQRALQLRDAAGMQVYLPEYQRRLGDVEAFAATYHTRMA